MTERYKYIENLLERFFEGQTSNKEEQELYDFFEKKDVPEHLQKYKQVFEYFDNGLVNEIESTYYQMIPAPNKVKHPLAKKIGFGVASIAASALIVLAFNPFSTKSFNPYEGSYIVENGVKVYDITKIMQQQEIMEQEIRKKEKEIGNIEIMEEKQETMDYQINQKEKDIDKLMRLNNEY